MTLSHLLVAIAAAVALADWWAVAHRPARLEQLCKPLVMVALIGAALTLHPTSGAQRSWFVVALVCSLAGDVFLLPKPDLFVPGLASFLLAHIAYVIGLVQLEGRSTLGIAALVVLAPVVVRVVGAVRTKEPALLAPVVAYITVIGAMVGTAIWFGPPIAVGGAALFAMSDSILALDRFDRHRPWMPLAVMITYHVAQGLLVVSLVS